MNRKIKLIVALAAAAGLVAVLVLALRIDRGMSEVTPETAQTPAPTLTAADSYGVGKVVINELMEKNRAVVTDSHGEFSDWVELKNISDETVSLAGFSLSDKPNGAWQLPEVELGAGELLLIFASGRNETEGELHTDFSIKGTETLYLKNASGTLVDEAACQNCEADISVARGDDGEYTQSHYPTPGFENSPEGYEGFQQTLSAKGPLAINEVMVSNFAVYGDYLHGYEDWVEIKNISGSSVELSDYYLSDSHKDYFMWQLPERELKSGECIIVLCDGRDDRTDELPGTNFSLNSENENLFLSNAEGVLDFASLRDIPYEGSYGRMEGRNGWFFFAAPSPGEENADGRRRVAETPKALTKDGIFNGVESVGLELSGEGTIRYTLDGSAPDEKSAVYTGPLSFTKTGVVRAACFADDALPSRPLTQSFIINENHSLPVLSLVTDSPADFEGMYWGMQKGVEEPASLSLYEQDGGGFTIGCGAAMNGETSLVMIKKNMSVRFRGAYGAETLDYDIYGGGVTQFTNLLLRSGQDYDRAIVRNELCQQLCALATDKVVNQRSIWCVLYINGEYQGLYTLKEKSNEQLYASLAGVSLDSVELLEADIPYDSEFYENIIYFCITNDMSLPENYARLCEQLDIDSLIDWTIVESYCANVDLTNGNLRYCRSTETDGKWRLMFYDLDSTFTTAGGGFANLLSDFAFNNRQVSSILCPLIKNAEFKDRFLTRAAELFSTVLNEETVVRELDRQCAIIENEVERDITRYNRDMDSWRQSAEDIKHFLECTDNGTSWQQENIDTLSRIFELSREERQKYFGEIEAK